jgi:hypothetical protein
MATLDHKYPRGHPKRGKAGWGVSINVLSCWECNAQRDRHFTAALPSETLWSRSNSWPRITGFMMYDLMRERNGGRGD